MPADADDYARRAAGAPRLAPSEVELVTLARSGQPQARARLIDAHRRIVAQVAKRFGQSDLSPEARLRLGEQGLGRAIDRFEPSKGFAFSTYAIWHIRQAILGGQQGGGSGAGAGGRAPTAPR